MKFRFSQQQRSNTQYSIQFIMGSAINDEIGAVIQNPQCIACCENAARTHNSSKNEVFYTFWAFMIAHKYTAA